MNLACMKMNAHREIDVQCWAQTEAAGICVENMTVVNIGYPLITRRVMSVFQQQLVHVHNGCVPIFVSWL
jgi:hypothetical protein